MTLMPEQVAISAQPYVVMAKPVGSLCNLKCSYCYYLKPQDSGQERSRSRMTDEILDTFIRQYIESCEGSVINFVWHGGEPTLAGLDFYKKAVQLQKSYLPEGKTCWNNLQTNGLLLSDEWCAFLAENNFDVGISIDGTQLLHDRYRVDNNGAGTYERVAKSVSRLMSHGVKPDLLCTVTSSSAKEPLSVYRALRALNTEWIQFIPIVRKERDAVAAVSVSAESYGEFLCAVFDEWVLNDIGKLEVQLFAETARVWSGGDAVLCWMAPTCGRALIVEQDGGVYSCDHFVTPEYRIGDIETTHLGKLVDFPEQRLFGENKRDRLPACCRVCQWLNVCNGGCPKDRFSVTDEGEEGLNYLCGGFKRFFSYVKPAVDIITMLDRRGQSPDAIMAYLKSQLRNLWKNIGRNDPCPCGSEKKAKSCCWDKRVT